MELPSLEDRKKFLGCLAAALASSYNYDDLSEEDDFDASLYLDDDEEEEESSQHDVVGDSPPSPCNQQHTSMKSSKKSQQSSKKLSKSAKKLLRYRKRRHKVASDFLLSSSDHLLLESYESEKLIPLLDTLLVLPSPLQQTSRNEDDDDDDNEDDNRILKEFINSMSSGSGFRCIILLLFQYLLSNKDGYDARVRHVIKKLGVMAIVHEYTSNNNEDYSINKDEAQDRLVEKATRKFESLEHNIAERLLSLASKQQGKKESTTAENDDDKDDKGSSNNRRRNLVRGLKIGAAGVVAGSLLVVTGGIAAPGIAAGLAAIGLSAVAGTFLALASSTAVVTIFGVAGGSLAMYKMNRRTAGLTEFEFQKEGSHHPPNTMNSEEVVSRRSVKKAADAELMRTVCISGWLRDVWDFQRPWGVQPTNPPLFNKVEILERYYSIYNPKLVQDSEKISKHWIGDEKKLWNLLKEKYGVDPDNLFPLHEGSMYDETLSKEEEQVLDKLIVEIGEARGKEKNKGDESSKMADSNDASSSTEKPSRAFARFRKGNKGAEKKKPQTVESLSTAASSNSEVSNSQPKQQREGPGISDFEHVCNENSNSEEQKEKELPQHLATVWDYEANYGGELYTIKWESEVLMQLCNSVRDLALDLGGKASKEVLKHTVASALIIAAALPSTVYSAMNSIDGVWTLAIERSDEAGKELARSLLYNKAGHRPVTLVGYSFGARVIYSCLNELARCQDEWEDYQERKRQSKFGQGSVVGGSSRRWTRDAGKEQQLEYDREPASVIEDAILMGTPKYLNLTAWKRCRQILAGRLVNVYSRNDLILSYMFKYKRLVGGLQLKGVCGTCTIAVNGVENVDVSNIIKSHQDYTLFVGDILKKVKHGQPVRLSQNAVDEAALVTEAEQNLVAGEED